MEVELNDDTIQYSVPAKVLARCRVDPKQFQEFDENSLVYWNSHILSLVENKDIVNALEKLCYFTVNEQIFRNILVSFYWNCCVKFKLFLLISLYDSFMTSIFFKV